MDDLSTTGITADWAGRIGAAWQKSTAAIFETGRLILQAKEALPHGSFTEMIDGQLPFGTSTAQRLMAIARDDRLANPAHVQLLPPSWGTLYELTKLDDDALEQRFADGTIRPDMERSEVEAVGRSGREAVNGNRAIMSDRREPADSLDYFPTPPWATRALIDDVLRPIGWGDFADCLVWEPACGEGHIAGVLEEYAADVVATDIFNYSADGRSPPGWAGVMDFLDDASGRLALEGRAHAPDAPDWIITNPPFGELSLQFALKALRLAKRGVALFVRQQWLEGIDRYEQLFSAAPPTIYAQFAERVNLCKGRWDPDGTTATAYCWLVWIKGESFAPRSGSANRLGDPAPRSGSANRSEDPAPRLFWISPGRRVERSRPDDVERFTAHPVQGLVEVNTETSAPPPPAAPSSPRIAPLERSALRDGSEPLPREAGEDLNGIIRDGYGRDAAIAELMAATGLSKTAITSRAKRMGLGDRERQRAAVAEANRRRASAPLQREPQEDGAVS